MTPDGKVTDFPVPTPISGDNPSLAIIPGPNNTLWFTEPYRDKIGEITTSGVITEFNIPSAVATPTSITLGPDGAFWFTGSFGGGL